MADAKISDLTASAGLADEDLIAVVDDPSGTPVTKKGTLAQVWTWIQTKFGTGVATFLATPSGANLASALTSVLSLSKVGAPTGTGLPTVTSGAWDAASLADGTQSYVLEMGNGGSGNVKRWALRDRVTIANTTTGTQNDVATTDANSNQAEVIRWTGDDTTSSTITSLASPTQSRVVVIVNAAGGDPSNLTIDHEAATGTAANRILCPGNEDIVVRRGYAVILRYDSTSTRWRVVGGTARILIDITSANEIATVGDGPLVGSGGQVDDGVGFGTAGQVLATNGTADGVEWVAAASFTAPTGTGVMTTTAGAMDAAASLGTAYQVLRTNSGATDVEWATSSLDGIFVNIMDYWDAGDPTPTIDGHTTRNIDLALQRAYAAMLPVPAKRMVLWIPPCDGYGVDAWSWRTALTWQIDAATDNVIYLEIRGSGAASPIYCDTTTVGNVDKLTIASAGPEGMPTIFRYTNMVWCGQGTANTEDCISLLATTADMQVLVEDCIFYGLLATGDGLLDLSAMGLTVRRTYMHHCGNTNAAGAGAMIAIYSGIFGCRFEQFHVYNYERNNDPFDSTTSIPLNKLNDASQYTYSVWLRGDTEVNAPHVIFEHCNFSSVGNLGACLADPSADGFYIRSVTFSHCTFIYNVRRVIRAVGNVDQVTLDSCHVYHNDASVDSVALTASTCRRLSVYRTKWYHSGLRIKANTGQVSVVIRENSGGDWTVDGCGYLDIDDNSTFDALASGTTAAPGARVKQTAITQTGTGDTTLTATQYAYRNIVISGVAGGAFNVIAPNGANCDGAEYCVTNLSDGACTFKKSGGTGVTIATLKTATVRYIHASADYVRITGDA